MLEILSETKDPIRVQPHLKKCFEGIEKLQFDENLNILSIYSSEGENVKLIRSVSTEETKGAVEKWLFQVQETMLASVKKVIVDSYMVACVCLCGCALAYMIVVSILGFVLHSRLHSNKLSNIKSL